MKESYPDDIMLCFVQGFGDGDRMYNKIDKCKENEVTESNNNTKLSKRRHQKRLMVQIPDTAISEESLEDACSPDTADSFGEQVEFRSGKLLSAGDGSSRLPDVKGSLSDRFSAVSNGNGKKPSRGLLTVRKTWSTGNFASGAAGGGCGAPRSAPATPLQLEPHPHPHPRASKHDKHAVKPLSGSAPSVRAGGAGSDGAANTTEGKAPSKARQKKFQRHFPQVGPEERVLNYYSCALVGDLLLQGHLYITKNYFAFYSNVFGYVTKLLIPITSVLRITKEKVARIIPNAVGVCTRDERHVFGSLLSRDSTYKLMTHVWKAARVPELAAPKPPISEVELDASEYSPEDDSSSAGGDHHDAPVTPAKRDTEAIISTVGAAVIQPALLTGSTAPKRDGHWGRLVMMLLASLLACSALVLAYRLYHVRTQTQEELLKLSGEELYSELMRWRTRLHGRAANELHAFLTTNLLLLTKVRQSLEALSGVILTDMAPTLEVPETGFS